MPDSNKFTSARTTAWERRHPCRHAPEYAEGQQECRRTQPCVITRRRFLQALGALSVGGYLNRYAEAANSPETIKLPFANGQRTLVAFPQKRPLILLTTRPPQLETPFSVFNKGLLTPNDAFFVRYHLTLSPPAEDLLKPDVFRISIGGAVQQPLKFSVAELKQQFENVEIVAVDRKSVV